ncbi:MAG TPA: HD domain-containing protein [Candidatus Peribacterales bacterium]|nr:HD domain-containing protein [Candidatus Peribacterales bacterium]
MHFPQMRKQPPFFGKIQYLAQEDARRVKEAYLLALELYGNCLCHPGGESCIIHAENIVDLLLVHKPDAHTLIACILQCIREPEHQQKVDELFGKEILSTIAADSVLDGGCGGFALRPQGTIRRIVQAFSKDVRVLFIALYNRLYILKKADQFTQRQQSIMARETLDIFAPLCARLGIYSLKYELEALAFRILYPEESKHLEGILENLRKQHGPLLAESKRSLARLLSIEGKNMMIISREKHPYSIFQKLQRKSLTSPTDLHDLFGMRVLVDSEEECYQVLGIIHRAYRPLSHRMKDYIAMPKPNGYRSLHTTVLGVSTEDSSLPVEIQIRTYEMDEEAEHGIAAHWDYKQHGSAHPFTGTSWQKRLEGLLAESTSESMDEEDMAEEIGDRIFALTPKGDVIELPKGAGPLDFAFRIHTDLGLRYRYAKINGAIAAIDEPIDNGDHVQVTVWSEPKPSRQWLQTVKTKEARQKLRSYFRMDGEKRKIEPSVAVRQTDIRRKGTPLIPSSPSILLESQVPLPYRFARCCEPDKHSPQRPPIIGYITRDGAVRIHWSGCRMILSANHDRLIRASWATSSEASLKASALSSGI